MIPFVLGIASSLTLAMAYCCCKVSGLATQQERELGIE